MAKHRQSPAKRGPTYVAAHFGKWGMGASPEILGFEVSDGATRNVDGGFVNDKSQWETTMTRDPKKSSS